MFSRNHLDRWRWRGAGTDAARAGLFVLLLLLLLTPASALRAQEHPRHPGRPPTAADTAQRMDVDGMMMPGPLGISPTREGSGTSWLPDGSPMYAIHSMGGRWEVMLHGNGFLQYVDEGSERGDEHFGSVHWLMGMARRPLAGGSLIFRAMMSLEPITVGECGYPDVLATGEFCDELGPLHDRQHPHDLFMELTASYERALTRTVGLALYGGPVGEPALGPGAYPHRVSAFPNLFAPISHHWQDATHISFGVVTAGLFGRRWKLEGSLFNGREPDEERFDIDLDVQDSYSGRIWLLPSDRWTFQVSTAHLNEAERHHPDEPRIDVNRTTASVTHHAPVGPRGYWASTLAWGRNDEDGAPHETSGFLLESALNLDERNVFFGRGELVEKTSEDLDLDDTALDEEVFTVGKLSLGYMRQFGPFGSLMPALGASLSVSFVGDDLRPFYGETTPFGFSIFVNLKPRPMQIHDAHAMEAPAPGAEAAPPTEEHDALPTAHPTRRTRGSRTQRSSGHLGGGAPDGGGNGPPTRAPAGISKSQRMSSNEHAKRPASARS